MKLTDKILVKISKNIIPKIDKIFKQIDYDYTQVMFVTDNKIWNNNKDIFEDKFLQKFAKFLILNNPQADEENAKIVAENSKNIDLIFAFGSGTINDLCKYTAKKLNKKYLILISALSMNGYVSKNASIAINNHKKTFEATLPIAVLCDLSILKKSPIELTKAGLADVLCFYSCYFDLMLSKYIFLQKINSKALNLQRRIIKNFTKNYAKYSFQDDKFLKILLKMILNSGWAMTIAKSSAPASQSEHLLAHVLTMKYQKLTNILHGRIIASTTIFSLENQYKILHKISQKYFIENFFNELNNLHFNKEIIEYFGKDIAQECLAEYNLKLEYFQQNLKKIIKNYHENFAKINQKLKDSLVSKEFLIKIFNHFLVDYDFENIGVDNKQVKEAQQITKYIRNRITSSDC